MGSKTEKDKMDGKSFPILEDLGEEEDANIKVRRGILETLRDGGVVVCDNAFTCIRLTQLCL